MIKPCLSKCLLLRQQCAARIPSKRQLLSSCNLGTAMYMHALSGTCLEVACVTAMCMINVCMRDTFRGMGESRTASQNSGFTSSITSSIKKLRLSTGPAISCPQVTQAAFCDSNNPMYHACRSAVQANVKMHEHNTMTTPVFLYTSHGLGGGEADTSQAVCIGHSKQFPAELQQETQTKAV